MTHEPVTPPTAAAITVIVPTLCSESRGPALLRALRSARDSSQHDIEIVVVANGSHVSPDLVMHIRQSGATLLQQELGSYPLAVMRGRSVVRTDFFGFLDDDDELLPGALDRRLCAIQAHPEADVVVSNGLREKGSKTVPYNPSMHDIGAEPLRTLLERNWLASCSALYRTSSVGEHFFSQPHGFAEWTWLGFQLCIAGVQFHTIDSLDYIVHDSPGSLSKSKLYRQSYESLFERMLAQDIPDPVRRKIMQKRCDAFHALSVESLETGQLKQSAQLHCRSVSSPYGLRYLPYTRHIITRALATGAKLLLSRVLRR